jgi:hypothetical protein
MNWIGCGRQWSMPKLRCNPCIYQEELKKITETSAMVCDHGNNI